MQNETCDRFELRDGQFFGEFRLKNQQWFLNGKNFGFGDLRWVDIFNIKNHLEVGDKFEGFNEHHGTDWQQRENPMIVIEKFDADEPPFVDFPAPVRTESRQSAGTI